MSEEEYNETKLSFILDNQEKNIIKCHIKDRLINMLEVYCQIKNIKKESIYILYNGNCIDNYDITIDKLANKDSKQAGEVILLVNHKPNSVIIKFLHSGDLYEEKVDIEKDINSVLSNYLTEKNIDKNNIVLKYNDDIIEAEQTINQFITKYKIMIGNMNEIKDNNLTKINIDIIDIQTVSKIKFLHNNEIYERNYSLERNMGDIFKDYASENKIDEERVEFLDINKKTIKKNQSFKQFKNYINEKIDNKKNEIKNKIHNQSETRINSEEIIENYSKIIIDVKDLSYCSYFFKKYKQIIFIILAMIIVTGAVLLIVLLLKKINDKNQGTSSKTRNPIIPNDYFINATYISKKSETVKLISDEYDIKKIKNMSINGKIIEPIKSFTFNENGQHIIYYSFNYLNNKSLLSSGRNLFNGITNLIKIEISNYNGSFPDISFHGMFNNCINLQEADFSQMDLNYNYYYNYYSYEIIKYYFSMDYMFNNCKSLTSINFNFKMKYYENELYIISSRYMFNNCTSLKELNLNKLHFYTNLNNMFSNCTSLKEIYFSDFKYKGDDLNISYMFYNCSTITTLSFRSDQMSTPYDMSYSFAYCTSLKKLDLQFIDDYNYYNEYKKNMSNAFRNCTSLTSIDLQFFLLNFEDMSYAFMGCHSLQYLELVNYYYFPYVKYMNGMFLDCFSLKDIFKGGFTSDNLIDISYMFASSIVSFLDLSSLKTNNITNYEGLFYNCSSLSSVDLSSFTHNNLTGSKLSIFKGKYYSGTFLIINKEFLSKIYVPENFKIIIFNENESWPFGLPGTYRNVT